MKTSYLFSARTWGALLFTVLLSTACQQEEQLVKPAPTNATSVDQNLLIRCFRPIYIATFRFNARRVGSYCYYAPGRICIRFIRIWWVRCWIEPGYFERIKPNPCLSCPEEIFKLLPHDIIPDFRKELGDNLKLEDKELEDKENVIFFPITSGVIGLQSTVESEVLNRERFTLKVEIKLSEEEQKGLGVEGSVIPAGEYPVIFNERNNTYNALVGVK
jgi:hypothetical protein